MSVVRAVQDEFVKNVTTHIATTTSAVINIASAPSSFEQITRVMTRIVGR